MESKEYFEKVMQDYNQNRKGRSLRKYCKDEALSLIHIYLSQSHRIFSQESRVVLALFHLLQKQPLQVLHCSLGKEILTCLLYTSYYEVRAVYLDRLSVGTFKYK